MVEYFYTDVSQDKKYMIYNHFDKVPYYNLNKGGSFGVCYARLIGVSYPDFLRLCRDEFGAALIGKDCIYVMPKWEDPSKARPLVKLLNERLNQILKKKDKMKI